MVAFALSFVFMYLILAAQFEFVHSSGDDSADVAAFDPICLAFDAPRRPTTQYLLCLGILLLFGIVKKNAILQIDHTNELRSHGMARYSAILQANRDRLRPILMTTIALVAGMIPLVLGSGAGAATNRSIVCWLSAGKRYVY